MAKRESNLFQIKPPPPPNLNKELLGVWTAWSRIGDREVVREAAVKGQHIEFAHTFLGARKDLDAGNIKKLFKDEVFVWIFELLQRRQIFKASHILSNINLDPIEEFTNIFLETYTTDLRDYLGDHLFKSERLSPTDMEAWNLLKTVIDKREFLIDFNGDNLKELNINYLNNQSIEWKCQLGTQLFFKSFDVNIRSFVSAEYAWKFLLNNNVDLIKFWINTYFSKELDFKVLNINQEVYEYLGEMFLKFRITEEMIDAITEPHISLELQDHLFDELSKFGIFHKTERNSIISILKRLTQTENIDSLYLILNDENSSITLCQFYELLIQYCHKNELYAILNWCNVDLSVCCDSIQNYQSKYLDLLNYLRTENSLDNETGIGMNILRIGNFLSGDLSVYLENNPLVLFAILLFLYPDVSLLELIKQNVSLNINTFEISPQLIKNALARLPFLNSLIVKREFDVITLYDILKKHSNLNMDIFNFRRENTDVPNFNTTALQSYAYRKTSSYILYLKQGRPSFASKMYLAGEHNTSKSLNKLGINRKILKFFFLNLTNAELAVSCVSFLEMIGENSEGLRIYVKVVELLQESKLYSNSAIQQLLLSIFHNPENVVQIVENELTRNCLLNRDSSAVELIDEIKKQDIVVKLAQFHNFRLPERFLNHCAENNLWFPFLIFIQTYNYPLAQVQKLLQNFANPVLAQHLYHGLSNEIQIDSQKELLMRDSRTFYLSRIGVRKNVDASSDSMYSSASSYGSTGSSSTSSDFFDGETLDFETDMLRVLIKCHNSVDPPKALLQTCFMYKSPIFAVFAASYEPDSAITHWLMWLTVSCGLDGQVSSFELATIDADVVSNLLVSTIRMGYCRVLHDSFKIFLPDNPLKLFVDFLNNCTDLNFDMSAQTVKLELFSTEVNKRKISTPILQLDYEMMYLSNKVWIQSTALNLLAAMLQHSFTSKYNQLSCIKFLHDIDIYKYFSTELPDFFKYFKILKILFDSKCDTNLNVSVIFKNEDIDNEVLMCINKLVATKSYESAFQIAGLHGMSTDFIIIDEWYYKFKYRTNFKDFWDNCNYGLNVSKVEDGAAVQFFEQCCEETADNEEKYIILSLACKWASTGKLESVYDLETKMWMSYLTVDPTIDCDFFSTHSGSMLYGEMTQILKTLQNNHTLTLSEIQRSRLTTTIETLLNLNDFWQALRLTKMYDLKNNDVNVIELCCNLAEGYIMPYQLNTEQRLLLIKTNNIRTLSHRRRRTLLSSKGFSSLSTASHSPVTSTMISVIDHVDVPFHDTLSILETLLERVKSGAKVIQNILQTYRIAINIEKSYQDVFKCSDSTTMLKDALKEDCCNKLEVVHDVISLFNWSKEKVADFLSEQLIDVISHHIKANSDTILLWNLNLDTDFNLILQLLVENCSILGLKLYSYASTLHKLQSKEEIEMHNVSLVIELLIRSHDCFTADCNMEGISIILKKCQSIISFLLALKNWKYIVRLLTGVARYTEMNYVFHVLRENDQFEFLLYRGSRKDNSLKVALFKYLKNYCSKDRELYRMVALHFTLFSEIAQLWEEEAKSIVRNLIAISKLEMQNNGLNIEAEPFVLLTNTDGTKICLNRAMVNYTHAAEYHLQGEKLTKAMNATKHAELLALQMSMLKGLTVNNTTTCFLNIPDDQILTLICTELNFPQSLILINSNNYKPDWSTVLFEQYIIRNQINYLDNFLTSFALSDLLLHDISRKFLSLNTSSGQTTKNMKDIVSRCSSVRVKYRIASELGFADIVEEILCGNQLAYLKDTVWKKGYKS